MTLSGAGPHLVVIDSYLSQATVNCIRRHLVGENGITVCRLTVNWVGQCVTAADDI